MDFSGLGSFGILGERMLLRLLRRIPVKSLLRLMECSKSMWCFANYPKIWKRICIKRWEGEFRWKATWKLTAVLPWHCDLSAMPSASSGPYEVEQSFYDSHFPILSRRHLRSSVPIERFYGSTRQDLPRVDARTTTREQFLELFDRPCRPCIIVNAMQDWPCMTRWTPEQLAKRFEGKRFLTDEVNSKGHKMKMSLENYFLYFQTTKDADPIYLFDPKFVRHCGEDDDITRDYQILPYFQEDFFSLLSAEERPFYRWLVFGPRRSGSCFHTDPYFTSAWNALVSGEKRWILYPPSWTPPGVTHRGGDRYDAPVPMKWMLEHYVAGAPGAVECTQRAGEIMWVPSRWWHMVLNTTDTVAVTQNLCNTSNWGWVWPEVLEDRPMAEELKQKLAPQRPELFPGYDPTQQQQQDQDQDGGKKKKGKKKKNKKKKSGNNQMN